MLTITVYFRIKNHELFNYKNGYIGQSMEFDTSEDPEGLKNIFSLPETLRKSVVQSFGLEDEDVQVISKKEYEEETEEE